MKAGSMDRRITIRRPYFIGTEGQPGAVREWEDVATVWAKVKQESGREFYDAGGKHSERKIVFTIRWLPVGVIDRVLFEEREFDIAEVRELGRRAGIELHAVG
jgi:SPP1 family predicted phage head-tail adaptor